MDDFEEFAAKNNVTCSGEFRRGGAMRRVNRRSQEYIHFPWIKGTDIVTDSVGYPGCAQESKITIMHLRFGSQNAASCANKKIWPLRQEPLASQIHNLHMSDTSHI